MSELEWGYASRDQTKERNAKLNNEMQKKNREIKSIWEELRWCCSEYRKQWQSSAIEENAQMK